MSNSNQPMPAKTSEQQRAWDLLAAAEDHPRVRAWLAEIETARPRRPIRAWASAAAVVLTIGLGTGAWLIHSAGTHYQTRVGEQRDVTLPDGSKVTMNTATELTVRYSDQRRYIVLERGEALFAVKHDPGRPFDVAAGDTLTRALGTEFNVDMRHATVTVSVLDGAVRVAAATSANASPDGIGIARTTDVEGLTPLAALARGQALEFRLRDRHVRQEQADLKRIDGWRTRRLQFTDKPLSEAVEEFNRYSTTPITVGTPELGAVRVSGVFRIGDQKGFLFSLQEALNVESHESEHEIVLLRAAAGR